jgi:hypothetical protein
VSKKMMYGGSVIKPIPPLQIQIISDVLEWANDGGAETDQVLRNLANYLYWLSESFQLEAQNIISGPGGGSVAPTPSGGAYPNDLDFEVTASSFMVTGVSSITISQFIGYDVDFARGGIMQNTTSLGDGSSYYAWNRVTGLFSIYPAASVGELFRIMVDSGGGVITTPSLNTPDTIILSSDGTYTLASGNQIWKITINPSVADTVRIGTTLNGEEIMMDKVMTINTYANNGVTADVFAEGSDATIYFTGFTGAATINIYTLPI